LGLIGFTDVDYGTIAITTRRITYTGGAKTAPVMYRDLVTIEGDLDRNVGIRAPSKRL
jgi:hypothetical protein